MAFRDDIKLQVQQSTNIVDLIGEQLLLKHKGREFVGLCPFHEDRNPSMYVSPGKQIFHCFVCGAGGDVFGWMMKYHKMTFPEAIRFLAERAGIKIEETREQAAGSSDRQMIGEANGLALMHFQKLFRHPQQGAIARAYIEKRQIPAQLVEAFQIGYAPDGWDGLVKSIAANKWNQRAFELAGLISRRDRDNHQPSAISHQPSSFYDRLRHRIIFPICDGLGRPIAFGGRKIRDEDEPKYLNSPETALFNKSRTLYGLHLAKKAIIDSRTAIIVEGYVDVIGCHVLGSANAVATLGTALTVEHVRELKKYCDKVVLTFDADAAGQRAADRAVEIFLTEEVDVAIAVVPEGKDPGDLMLSPDGPAKWKTAIAAATDALDYQFARVRQELDKAGTMTGRQRVAEDYLRRIAGLDLRKGGLIRKAMVTQRLANLLHMSEEAVNGLLKRFIPVRKPTIRPAGQIGGSPAAPLSERAAAGPDEVANNAEDSPLSGGVTNNAGPVNTAQPEKSQQSSFSNVASQSFAANIGLVRAERQFMGCLLREPGLFHMTLADGRMLDEALTPAEMVTPEGRELYELMYERLSDGREMSLAALLGDLAERGLDHLASVATQMEHELDAMITAGTGQAASVPVKLVSAVLKLRDHAASKVDDTPAIDAGSPDEALRKQLEIRKANRSPLNIMRS